MSVGDRRHAQSCESGPRQGRATSTSRFETRRESRRSACASQVTGGISGSPRPRPRDSPGSASEPWTAGLVPRDRRGHHTRRRYLGDRPGFAALPPRGARTSPSAERSRRPTVLVSRPPVPLSGVGRSGSSSLRVHAAAVVPVAVEDVQVDDLALLLEEVGVVLVG